ncbi:hypothetical protein HAX54_027103 [Datura stramonium]|uniref:Alpha-1,3-glucosyltransferase n=1 Tax=Datura stramonium TaxID=4076 RepID=A0ABS8V463_DATST|nr:hypothetical protein [Datura stramonium]
MLTWTIYDVPLLTCHLLLQAPLKSQPPNTTSPSAQSHETPEELPQTTAPSNPDPKSQTQQTHHRDHMGFSCSHMHQTPSHPSLPQHRFRSPPFGGREGFARGGLIRGFRRLVIMGSAVVAVFAAAYGPFLYHGQIQQVFHRMFPFGRGLCHAYWAPNFWVFYIILDKVLAFLLIKMGFNVQAPTASFTGGLVGDSSPFAVLPRVTPIITFSIVLLAISPCLVKAWRDPQPRMITRWIAYAYTCGFMFGWHIHEKASLHFVIPLAIIAFKSVEDAKHYFYLSIVSCYSLFPLLFEAQEYPIKVLLLLLHATLMWIGFSSHFTTTKRKADETEQTRYDKTRFIIGWFGKLYLLGLLAVEIYGQFVHPILFAERLPFLPLMMISIYCAFGMMYSWIWQLRQIINLD